MHFPVCRLQPFYCGSSRASQLVSLHATVSSDRVERTECAAVFKSDVSVSPSPSCGLLTHRVATTKGELCDTAEGWIIKSESDRDPACHRELHRSLQCALESGKFRRTSVDTMRTHTKSVFEEISYRRQHSGLNHSFLLFYLIPEIAHVGKHASVKEIAQSYCGLLRVV